MSKLERNRERKREEILQAAQAVFLTEGYVLAAMDHIAERAQVTKQTVYRYFPSKAELFKATLQQMGTRSEMGFIKHLKEPDTKTALKLFAVDFIQTHLSKEHLAIYKLLISESAKAPEITDFFRAVGPDETEAQLGKFFSERFEIENTEIMVQLWSSVLLGQRSAVLIGAERPSEDQIDAYAEEATRFLLAAVH